MVETAENTTVVIVGAGVAGLTLGNFLLRRDISCIIVEKHSRAYVETRQRAGTVDSRGVRMFREWGLDDVVKDASSLKDITVGTWIDGVMYPIGFQDDDTDTVFCPQQVLVRNLTDAFLKAGGDLRFKALDVDLEDIDSECPTVRYRSPDGSATTVTCDFVAGCKPASALTCPPAASSTSGSCRCGPWYSAR
ncbi:FAD-dependent monooxygenase [Streptomyces sp. bgisy084]|uniref:FAD-dependent monooxygenase n=1 Tax=unclassified Streptomyces TaxID=2593676 RepID=UPI003D734D80